MTQYTVNPPTDANYVTQTADAVFEPDLPGEEWRGVVGFEGVYQISNKGRLKRIARGQRATKGRISTRRADTSGYVEVRLYYGDLKKRTGLHRLVMEAFVGPANGLDVNHKDGNKSNNNLENLEYVTRRENMLHATHVLKTLTHDHVKGENSKHAKLTQRQVDMIRDLYALGTYTHKDLVEAFHVSLPNIAAIINGRSWKDSMTGR